jgi:hypothetical protein
MMMEAVRTSETSVDNHFTRQYNPEDSSEHHTHRRENLKSLITNCLANGGVLSLIKVFLCLYIPLNVVYLLSYSRSAINVTPIIGC